MIQAWIDDSGKTEEPVYVLAGFVNRVRRWETYSHDWERALKLEPAIPYLHTNEASYRKCSFAGWKSEDVDKRLLKFVEIIKRRIGNGGGGIRFTMDHADYKAVTAKVNALPLLPADRRKVGMLKNPYYFGFQAMVITLLGEHAMSKHNQEPLQILFDQGIDRPDRLKSAYRDVIKGIGKDFPDHVKLLVNKEAEFRDSKLFLPLQAADLLAWNVRRDRYENMQGKRHRWKVWEALKKAVPYRPYHYSRRDIAGIMARAANVPIETML